MKIPEGWKLVPVEPTEEMREAGAVRAGTFYDSLPCSVYAAMLAAAPTPPAQEAEPAAIRRFDIEAYSIPGYRGDVPEIDYREIECPKGEYVRYVDVVNISPANDELRQAAEELCGANDIGAFGTALVKLRSALEKK